MRYCRCHASLKRVLLLAKRVILSSSRKTCCAYLERVRFAATPLQAVWVSQQLTHGVLADTFIVSYFS